MATLAELCPQLSAAQREHLVRLMRTWAPLADMSFADLLLCVPDYPEDSGGYVTVGHMRPSTSRSIYRTEMVGQRFEVGQRPFFDLARATGQIIDGGMISQRAAPRIRTLSVPVCCGSEVVAVLSRDFSPDEQREPGELEMNYFFTFRRLAQMIAEGTFPFAVDETENEEPPRVSDGILVVDASARVRFASPNAVSVLSRLGVRRIEGSRLSDAGLRTVAVRACFGDRLPHSDEIALGDQTVVLWSVPLIEADELTGAVVLVRDISELRSRDRLLLSKDATIAEIHHRVKNNLQTISSLLRLQGRRVVAPEAHQAIDESVRRIQSIALVHEILSQEVANDVPFEDVVRPLVRVVEESFSSREQPLAFTVTGDAGMLATHVATPLAVVLSELMHNAVEHGFSRIEQLQPEVTIEFADAGDHLRVLVTDNGAGVPEDFDVAESAGLGLTIVQSLVENDLGGTISIQRSSAPGTVVELTIPHSVGRDGGLAAAVGRRA